MGQLLVQGRKLTPVESHKCAVPYARGEGLGAVWQCDCGQLFEVRERIIVERYGDKETLYWKRISIRRARTLRRRAHQVS